MLRPKVMIFDVNKTLPNVASVKPLLAKRLVDAKNSCHFGFQRCCTCSPVETLSGSYHGFGETGTALMMVAETRDIELPCDDAKSAVGTPLRSYPPHQDVMHS